MNAGLQKAAERKFGWIERLSRGRLVILILFWLIVGVHAVLYFNAEPCWFTLPERAGAWADTIYGERRPPECQCIYQVGRIHP